MLKGNEMLSKIIPMISVIGLQAIIIAQACAAKHAYLRIMETGNIFIYLPDVLSFYYMHGSFFFDSSVYNTRM